MCTRCIGVTPEAVVRKVASAKGPLSITEA